jgi:hypothetical protein
MKSSIFFLSIFITICSCSEELPAKKVPSVVQNSVKNKFPAAIDIDWKKNVSGYEAEFDLNNVEYTVHIDSTGYLLLTKHDIKSEKFPVAVTTKINTDYNGYKIDDAEIIERDTMIYYQAELESNGKKDLKLVFFNDGRLATKLKYVD